MDQISYHKGKEDGAWYMFKVIVITYIVAYFILELLEPITPCTC
jgi:hypothetical protein